MSQSPSIFQLENTQLTLNNMAARIESSEKDIQDQPTIASEETPRQNTEASRDKRKRSKNIERGIVSAKKNSESNIINQFFSYFLLRD
jgi:hypothetical protein